MKKIICLLLLLSGLTLEAQVQYFGRSKYDIVHVRMHDSVALVEVCHRDHGPYITRLDSLKRYEKNFRKGNLRIIEKNGSFVFRPGRIALFKDSIDKKLYPLRNKGYLLSTYFDLCEQLSWLDGSHLGLNTRLMGKNLDINMPPEEYFPLCDLAVKQFKDSVFKSIRPQFNRIKICNDRWVNQTCFLESSDSVVISDFWNALRCNHSENKVSVLFYMLDYAVCYVGICVYNPWFILLYPVPLLASFLPYYAAHFLIDRFFSRMTYNVKFYHDDKVLWELKIYGNCIENDSYRFRLKDNFTDLVRKHKK